MKKVFLASFVLFGLTFSIPAQAHGGEQKEPLLVHVFPADSIRYISIVVPEGNIEIIGTDSDTAIVEMFITPSLKTAKTKWDKEEVSTVLLQNYTTNTKVENGIFSVSIERYEWSKYSPETSLDISFKIKVKSATSTRLHTTDGTIYMMNMEGTHDCNTANGDLQMENIRGNLMGRTAKGHISISGLRDTLDLACGNGNITADDCVGNITLRTNVGDMELSDLHGNIIAFAVGGDILAKNLSGDIMLRSHGGHLVGQALNGRVVANTIDGNMSLLGVSGDTEAGVETGKMEIRMQNVRGYLRLSSNRDILLTIPAKTYALNIRGNKQKAYKTKASRKPKKTAIKDISVYHDAEGPELRVFSERNIKLVFR